MKIEKLNLKIGIHPDENKYTKNSKIEEIPLPQKVVLPLSQHTGAPSKSIVNIGDKVKTGQKIAELGGKISSFLHASISGTVVNIGKFLHPVLLKEIDSITIESDKNDTKIISNKVYNDYFRYSPEELIDVIKQSGIVGLGGAAFPTYVKLSPSKSCSIDTVILNGCECEPYLTCDDALMIEKPKEIITGLKIIMHILNADKCIIAIEDNKKEAIEKFKKIILNEPKIFLRMLKTKYPQGAEKQLINVTLNRVVPSGGIPLDIGVVVHNVGTAFAIYNAIFNGIPLYSRVITVSGKGVEKPGNYLVRIGTPVSFIAEFCKMKDDTKKVIIGGPMMGISQISLDVPVIKGTSGILFLTQEEIRKDEYQVCIKCGKCINVCPMNLLPNCLSIYAEKGMFDVAKNYFPLDCIECGCCSYVCPANRPIVGHIKLIKSKILSKN